MKPRRDNRGRAGEASSAPPPGRTPARAALLALTVAVLAACQTTRPETAGPNWHIEPLMRVTSAGETAAAYYSLGRYLQGQNRLDLALDAYRRAIAIDRRHAEAHNAIGAILGAQGRLDAAVGALRAALEIAPGAPHILSNLGYALMLAGRQAEAIALLQRACELDPDNRASRANLALALSKVGPAATPTGEVPVVAPAGPDGGAAVRDVGERPEPTASAVATEPRGQEVLHRTYRLEIANGNGVTGAAARFGAMLARDGAPRARLTNRRPFDRKTSVIYAASGFEAQAQRLASRLGDIEVRVEPSALNNADVRVVLGRDVLPMLAASGKKPVALALAGARRSPAPTAKAQRSRL